MLRAKGCHGNKMRLMYVKGLKQYLVHSVLSDGSYESYTKE